MGFNALLRCLAARKLILGWAALVGLAVGLAAGALLPRTYESSAKVLVDSIQKDMVTGLYEPRLRVSEYLGQQAAIAGSRAVALEAFDALVDEGFIAPSDFDERWRRETGGEIVAGNDSRLWAADELVENLFVSADSVEGTLSIAYRGDDPGQASRVANSFAAAYMKTVLDQRQRRAARSAASFTEERQTLERDLEGAQRDLSEFREGAGIVAMGDNRLETAELELTSLATSVANARADLSQAQALWSLSQQSAAEGLKTLALGEDLHGARQAQQRLGEVAAALQALGGRFDESYPDYVDLKRQKETLEASIRLAVQDRVEYAERRLRALERDAGRKKTEVVSLQKVKETYDRLENKVSASRDTYALVANRTMQEAMQSRVDDLDVVLLSRAVPPTEALTPPFVVIALLGLMIGAVLGAGVAVAVEFAEGRIRDAATVRRLLRAPVLAEIPAPPRAVRRRRRKPAARQAMRAAA
ncbi:MAG: hypothetical protein ABL957_01000 [Parvularculaceae bacterium]